MRRFFRPNPNPQDGLRSMPKMPVRLEWLLRAMLDLEWLLKEPSVVRESCFSGIGERHILFVTRLDILRCGCCGSLLVEIVVAFRLR